MNNIQILLLILLFLSIRYLCVRNRKKTIEKLDQIEQSSLVTVSKNTEYNIDAAILYDNQYHYLFKNIVLNNKKFILYMKCKIYESTNDSVSTKLEIYEGYPKVINSNKNWKGLTFNKIDAAVFIKEKDRKVIYFYSGKQIQIYDIDINKVVENINIEENINKYDNLNKKLDEDSNNIIDCVVNIEDKILYYFVNDQYATLDIEKGGSILSFKNIKDEFPTLNFKSNNIKFDSCVPIYDPRENYNNNIIFFKDDKYFQYDMENKKINEKHESNITEQFKILLYKHLIRHHKLIESELLELIDQVPDHEDIFNNIIQKLVKRSKNKNETQIRLKNPLNEGESIEILYRMSNNSKKLNSNETNCKLYNEYPVECLIDKNKICKQKVCKLFQKHDTADTNIVILDIPEEYINIETDQTEFLFNIEQVTFNEKFPFSIKNDWKSIWGYNEDNNQNIDKYFDSLYKEIDESLFDNIIYHPNEDNIYLFKKTIIEDNKQIAYQKADFTDDNIEIDIKLKNKIWQLIENDLLFDHVLYRKESIHTLESLMNNNEYYDEEEEEDIFYIHVFYFIKEDKDGRYIFSIYDIDQDKIIARNISLDKLFPEINNNLSTINNIISYTNNDNNDNITYIIGIPNDMNEQNVKDLLFLKYYNNEIMKEEYNQDNQDNQDNPKIKWTNKEGEEYNPFIKDITDINYKSVQIQNKIYQFDQNNQFYTIYRKYDLITGTFSNWVPWKKEKEIIIDIDIAKIQEQKCDNIELPKRVFNSETNYCPFNMDQLYYNNKKISECKTNITKIDPFKNNKYDINNYPCLTAAHHYLKDISDTERKKYIGKDCDKDFDKDEKRNKCIYYNHYKSFNHTNKIDEICFTNKASGHNRDCTDNGHFYTLDSDHKCMLDMQCTCEQCICPINK